MENDDIQRIYDKIEKMAETIGRQYVDMLGHLTRLPCQSHDERLKNCSFQNRLHWGFISMVILGLIAIFLKQ